MLSFYVPKGHLLTFALQTLSKKPFEKLLAVLANCWTCVGVDDKSVRHFNLGQ